MAEISFEEAVGGGPAKVSSSSLPSRAFQPTAISFEEAMGIPPLKSPVPGFKEPSPLGFALEGLKAMGGETAALADLVLALPGFLTGVGAQLGGTVQAAARGVPLIADPRQLNSLTAYGVGRAAGEEFGGTAMQATSRINPLRKLMEFVGAEDAIEQSATTKGLEKLTSLLDRAGRWAENATGGRVARDAVPMFAETLLASTIGLGAKRPGPIPEHVQKAMRKQQEKMRAEAEAELAAEPTPLEQAAQTPVHQQINEMLGIRPPTEQARVTRQRRLDAQAAFAERGKPRELLPEEQSALDVAEARGTRTYETAGEQLFTAEERLAREESYRGSLPREEAAAYEVGSYRPPKRIDQAEVLRVLKKPGFERTAGDLVVLRAARQEGKAMPEALMLLGAAGIGATAGGLLDDDALRGAVLGGAAAAAPLAMMSGLRAGGVPRAFREAGAVKGPGGMWHPEAVERLTAPLERRLRANLPADKEFEQGPRGPRSEAGFIDQRLVVGLSTIGLGGLIGSLWADDPVNGAVLGTLAGGALGFGTRGYLKDAVGTLDNAFGMVSTRLKNASPALHQRLLTHEQQVLEQTHLQLNRTVKWMEAATNLPKATRTALDTAIFMKDSGAIAEINKGNHALVNGWRETRNTLVELGKKAQALGRFKEMLDEYFPQRVKDFRGLKKALDQPVRERIEKLIEAAEQRALARGAALSEVERDSIINRELRSQFRPAQYRPGYAKPRSIEQVVETIRPFYHTPQEALVITIREIVKDLEMAKLFGRDLVQRVEEGRTYTDVGASVGNILGREPAAGQLKPEKFTEVQQILLSRFGPGERSPAKITQDLQNLGYAGLLGDIPSALVQIGDTLLSIPAHGVRSTIIAMGRKLSGNARITAKDLYLMDHIAEDLAFGSTQVGASRTRQRLATAGGAAVGATAGALLQDDIKGALPGAAAGAFVGYASVVGTAAALNKVLKQGVFTPIDRFGKDIQLGAAHHKLSRWAQTEKGMKRLREEYGEAFGEEFQQLAADLRTSRMTPNVRSVLFAELSRTQPISKLEAPLLLLQHPNARPAWMLKRFMLKQADFIRREAYDKIKTGEPRKIAAGLRNLMEFVAVLGLGGATSQLLQNFILGRDVGELGKMDVLENALKTFGLSQYVLNKMTQGGKGPFEAVGGALLPPWMIMDKIITADPAAVQYIPVVGQIYYNWELGGREKAELAEGARAKREGRDVELSERAKEYRRERRRRARELREIQ